MTWEIFVLGVVILVVYWSLKSHIDSKFKRLEKAREADIQKREEALEKAGDWFKGEFGEIKERISSVKELVAKESEDIV